MPAIILLSMSLSSICTISHTLLRPRGGPSAAQFRFSRILGHLTFSDQSSSLGADDDLGPYTEWDPAVPSTNDQRQDGGYMMFGTPSQVIYGGGSGCAVAVPSVYAGNCFLSRLDIDANLTTPTSTIRFGLAQGANHEEVIFQLANLQFCALSAPPPLTPPSPAAPPPSPVLPNHPASPPSPPGPPLRPQSTHEVVELLLQIKPSSTSYGADPGPFT